MPYFQRVDSGAQNFCQQVNGDHQGADYHHAIGDSRIVLLTYCDDQLVA